MAYSELIKRFDKIRAYMRDFYVFGFKSRSEYDQKSARSYDDERRRIESWLGDYIRSTQTTAGKHVFLSVDSRSTSCNPLYKAWKVKSFTDGDITLHFLLFDLLYSPEVALSINELLSALDARVAQTGSDMTFDVSTLRKKLKEYEQLGLIRTGKAGRTVLYSRTEDVEWQQLSDAVDFFSEAAPCGVIGSFLQDKLPPHDKLFTFKHHYITQAMDSGILTTLFQAIREKRYVTIENLGKRTGEARAIRLLPLRIYISAQNGRQHLIALHAAARLINSYRLDYILSAAPGEVCPEYDEHRAAFQALEAHMWGVNCGASPDKLEHVEFDVHVAPDEPFIIQRLQREKRCGAVMQVDACTWRYIADVFDSTEMLPWLRTFISRITRLELSNKAAEERFKADLITMYRHYGLDGGDGV